MNESSQIQKSKQKTRVQFSQSAQLHQAEKFLSEGCDPQYAVPFSIPQHNVISLFKDIALQMNYQIIQLQENFATAVKKQKRKNVLQFLNCLSWWGTHRKIQAVKLTIHNNSKSLQSPLKLCRLKALSQFSTDSIKFIDVFRQKMERIKGAVPSSTYLFEPKQLQQQLSFRNTSNPFHLQTSSFYLFHRILTGSQKTEQKIKENLEKSLNQFQQAFKNLQESSQSLPTPLNNVIGIVKETTSDIYAYLSNKYQKNDQLDVIIPYMKISVERYVFGRVQILLKTMYLFCDREITQKFLAKRNYIRSTMLKEEIFEQVLVNRNIQSIPSLVDKKLRGGVEFCVWACPQLQKISTTPSPRQKIKHCQLMYAQLKSYFFQKLKMKYQLASMQDIIPVFIVVVLFTQVQNLRSQLNVMIDFINGIGQDFESEKRLLVNLSQSYNYIVRDWKIQI